MEKDNRLSYDEAIQKAETLIAQLESADAISMDEYKRLAAEVTSLLKQCRAELEGQGFGMATDTLL